MKPPPPVDPELVVVAGLRRAATHYGTGAPAATRAALARCARLALAHAATAIACHDALLFLLAYPQSAALHRAAARALERVTERIGALARERSGRIRRTLANTGLPGTELAADFGLAVARWLVDRFPGHAELHSFATAAVPLRDVLAPALLPLESEFAAIAPDDPVAFVEAAAGSGGPSALAWLVRAFDRLPAGDALREAWFDAVHPYVVIPALDRALSRSFVRGLDRPLFIHRRPLQREVAVASVVDLPLPPAGGLSAAERRLVVDAGRATLAALGRETEVISVAEPAGVAWHDLGRGTSIALYTEPPLRRSPLDSHVGFMLFKNGLPVAYGGAWPFLGTARIGVNVFAPYRGGESAWLFCQVLRTYAQRFGVRRFVVEPSQFGGDNREGLASGAFWFYYRLGFRPVLDRHARLAAAAAAEIERDPGHREPLAALRRYTGGELELRLPGADTLPPCDPAALSRAVTRYVADCHRGDRAAAESAALRRVRLALDLPPAAPAGDGARHALAALAPLLALVPDLARWPAGARRAVVALVRAKGDDEFRFHALLARNPRLVAAWSALARGATR